MVQIGRNITGFDGELIDAKYLIHDRGTKYAAQFDATIESAGIHPIRLPPRSPNLDAYAERFVLSIKPECLNKIIFAGEKSLHQAVKSYIENYHTECNPKRLNNCIPFSLENIGSTTGKIQCKKLLILLPQSRISKKVNNEIKHPGNYPEFSLWSNH